jgi:hypothetical protein
MNDLEQRPLNGALVLFGSAVKNSTSVYLASAIGPKTAFRDHLSMQIPAPANENTARSGAASKLSRMSLFWLDLVEVDGHVLLAAKFNGDVAALRELRCERSVNDVELAINTIFLDELFDTDNYADDTLIEFGTVICESLRARACKSFPGRSFVAESFSVDGGARIGVRLCQINHRKINDRRLGQE